MPEDLKGHAVQLNCVPNAFPRLETLILVYTRNKSLEQNASEVTKLVNDMVNFYTVKSEDENKENLQFDVTENLHQIKWLTVKSLTLKDISVLNPSILANIVQVFPNLVELNMSITGQNVLKTKRDKKPVSPKLKKATSPSKPVKGIVNNCY